jgi:hypothetical protein
VFGWIYVGRKRGNQLIEVGKIMKFAFPEFFRNSNEDEFSRSNSVVSSSGNSSSEKRLVS